MSLKSMTIEELVAEAYEIGHAHGMNALRRIQGQPARRVNDGWGPIAKEMDRRFRKPTRPDKEG